MHVKLSEKRFDCHISRLTVENYPVLVSVYMHPNKIALSSTFPNINENMLYASFVHITRSESKYAPMLLINYTKRVCELKNEAKERQQYTCPAPH